VEEYSQSLLVKKLRALSVRIGQETGERAVAKPVLEPLKARCDRFIPSRRFGGNTARSVWPPRQTARIGHYTVNTHLRLLQFLHWVTQGRWRTVSKPVRFSFIGDSLRSLICSGELNLMKRNAPPNPGASITQRAGHRYLHHAGQAQ
jgi:hypothetical protein